MQGIDINTVVEMAKIWGPWMALALLLIYTGHLRVTLRVGKKDEDK